MEWPRKPSTGFLLRILQKRGNLRPVPPATPSRRTLWEEKIIVNDVRGFHFPEGLFLPLSKPHSNGRRHCSFQSINAEKQPITDAQVIHAGKRDKIPQLQRHHRSERADVYCSDNQQ